MFLSNKNSNFFFVDSINLKLPKALIAKKKFYYLKMIKVKKKPKKENTHLICNNNIIVYRQLRHEHIADAINTVIAEMNDFLKHNKAANFDKSKVKTIDDMTAALAAMPEVSRVLHCLHNNVWSLIRAHTHVSIAKRWRNTSCMLPLLMRAWSASTTAICPKWRTSNKAWPPAKVCHYLCHWLSASFHCVCCLDVDGKSYSHPITKLSPLLADETVSKEIKLRMLMTFVMSESGVQVINLCWWLSRFVSNIDLY